MDPQRLTRPYGGGFQWEYDDPAAVAGLQAWARYRYGKWVVTIHCPLLNGSPPDRGGLPPMQTEGTPRITSAPRDSPPGG